MGGIRSWLAVGAGAGILAAAAILLLNGTILGFALEALLAVGAGAVAAYLTGPALVIVPAPAGGPGTPRNMRLRNGVSAGATVGVLAGIALTVVAVELIYSANFRDALAGTLANAGLQGGSGDGFLALLVGCSGCFYIILLPVIAAGFGALGAWIMGLIRPAGAPAPPAPPMAPPGPPPLPPAAPGA